VFPKSLEEPIMKENENEQIMDAGCQIDERRTPVEVAKPKSSMQKSGRRDIVYQWKAHTVNTDMGRLEVKAQLTQQRM